MKNITKRFFFYLLLLTQLIVKAGPGDTCPVAVLATDLSTASAEFKVLVKESNGLNAWFLLNKEAPALRTNIEELNLVSKNLDEITKAGGYSKWKALQDAGSVNDYANLLNSKGYSYLKNKFNSLDDVSKKKFMSNFPDGTPNDVFSALNDPNKGLLKKWKDGTIKGNPEGFEKYYYQSNDPVTHSDIGDFANPNNPNISLESGRMSGGGHGQNNIEYLNATGKQHNIEHTFDNGVRTGNIPDHKAVAKNQGVGQSWFPSNWTKQDIDIAAKQVIQKNQSTYNSLENGVILFDNYNGVRVGIIKTDGKFATIFPDNKFQPNSTGQLILNPKF